MMNQLINKLLRFNVKKAKEIYQTDFTATESQIEQAAFLLKKSIDVLKLMIIPKMKCVKCQTSEFVFYNESNSIVQCHKCGLVIIRC